LELGLITRMRGRDMVSSLQLSMACSNDRSLQQLA
jgi:hypothetical protein